MAWTGRLDDSGPVVPVVLHERDHEGDLEGFEGIRRVAGIARTPVDLALALSIVLLLVGALVVSLALAAAQ
ncbi:MAG: hypothetical protein ACT4QF_22540 [Sporichthyaceae bacterium]